MIIDRHDAWNAFGCYANRLPLRVGLSITPKVNNSVSHRHTQVARMSPGFLLQFVKQLLSNSGIGEGDFELWPGARDHLNQVTSTDDAHEIFFFVHDGDTLDVALFQQCSDLMQRHFRCRRYDVGGHNVFDSSRM